MRKIIYMPSILILAFGIISCSSLPGDGSNTLVKESANTKHTKKSILFLRQAGATVADSYQVSVLDYKSRFDTVAVGNVFTTDDDHGKANLNPKAINFIWLANDTLEISYDKNLRTFIKEKSVDGVTIVYKVK